MPKVTKYHEPNDQLRNSLVPLGGDDRVARNQKYEKARNYYEGRQKRHLDTKEGEPDDNVIINITKMAIDRTVAFLFPAMPELELEPKEAEETEDEEWLRRAWDWNGGIIFLQAVGLNGCLAGHNYVRVLPPKNGDEFPRLVNIDPTTIQTYYKADDVDIVVWHEIRWSVDDGQTTIDYVLDIINDEENERWLLRQYRSGVGDGGYTLEKEDVWESRYGPIIHWPHYPSPNRFYGTGEAEHLELNDALNLITSENMRINRYHSSPKTVGTGVSPDDVVETAVDGFWAVENEQAKIFNLEMRSEQQFSQQLAGFIFDNYLAQSRVVLLRGEVKDFQRVTNAGVRTVFMDMLSKNTILRWTYGRAIQQISRVMSIIAGRGEDMIPDVIHQDPLPTDESEVTNRYAIERAMNVVSKQTISQKLGYSWPDELERMKTEAKEEALQPPAPVGGQPSGKPGAQGQQPKKPQE